MRRHALCCFAVISYLFLAHAVHAARLVEDVVFSDKVSVEGQALSLNGVGVGRRLSEKFTVLALYLPAPAKDFTTAVKMKGAKRLEIVNLRPLSTRNMGKYFLQAMRDSSDKEALQKDSFAFYEFGSLFDSAGDRAMGDRTTLDFVPGTGLVVRVNGKAQGKPVDSEPIFNMLMESFTGAKARESMRNGLLGIVPVGTAVDEPTPINPARRASGKSATEPLKQKAQ
jgi:hypothetical protein